MPTCCFRGRLYLHLLRFWSPLAFAPEGDTLSCKAAPNTKNLEKIVWNQGTWNSAYRHRNSRHTWRIFSQSYPCFIFTLSWFVANFHNYEATMLAPLITNKGWGQICSTDLMRHLIKTTLNRTISNRRQMAVLALTLLWSVLGLISWIIPTQ